MDFDLFLEYVKKHPVLISALVGTGISLFLFRRWVAGGWCYSKARLDGKTVLITGANTGIGKETAIDLAKRGELLRCCLNRGLTDAISTVAKISANLTKINKAYQCRLQKADEAYSAKIIIACRSVQKAEAAQAEIIEVSGNRNVSVMELDLASLESIRQCAEKINKELTRLDILINNAGRVFINLMETKDGFELQFGTNHLGHFLFTNLLLDLIKKSSPARIVNLSSLAHENGDIHFDDLMLEKDYTPIKSYCQSKLANVLFTKELARRLEAGNIGDYLFFAPRWSRYRAAETRYYHVALAGYTTAILGPFLRRLMFKSAVEGAQTTIHCAWTRKLARRLVCTTEFHCMFSSLFNSDCKVKKPLPKAEDEAIARKLWEVSAELVGLEKKVE
ncbi:putative retinol dehydrogenase 13-like [Apostichopus japonicus]|uniref:Putative retinol dehydrogenase 13-like n=1 Tax=Stichopus japonicus TaxID=307972 RepID=A0A2G8JCN1_STIJA|nr:putative retinol dehydrogenase 13-like [Apostichopus japonicus]